MKKYLSSRTRPQLRSSTPPRLLKSPFVQFYEKGEPVARVKTDAAGIAEACLYPLAEASDLRVTFRDLRGWLFKVALRPGERRRLEVSMTPAVSISGRVLALDRSPQNRIVVQAIPEADPSSVSNLGARVSRALTPSILPGESGLHGASPQLPITAEPPLSPTARAEIRSLLPLPPFSETVLTDLDGNFRLVSLRPGRYQVRCHGPDRFIALESAPGTNPAEPKVLAVEPGRPQQGLEFVFPEAKKGVWRNFPMNSA